MKALKFHALHMLAAGGLALGLAAAPGLVLAQTAPAAKPDPRVLMGGFHPERMQSTTLAPHVAPMTVTAPENIPVNRLQVPAGFQVELWAHGNPGARMMTRGDKGTVFVPNRLLDKVYAVVDKGGTRETKVIASGMDRPNGLAFHKGSLYVAEGTKISRFDNIEDNLDNPPKPVVIYDDLPNHASHGWRYIGIGPDNKLYINVGAPCNIC